MNHHTATTTQAPDDADLLLPPGSDDENPAPVAEPAPATSTTDTTPADDFPDLLPETIVALREQGIDPATWVDPLDIALADVGFDIAKLRDVDITAMLLPAPRRKTVKTTVGELVLTREWNLPFNEFTHTRKVFGMNLPRFQRGLKWTRDQEVAYIESILRDLPTGMFMRTEVVRDEETGELHPLSGLLLDGQQRNTTLERFVNDEFGICGDIRFSQFSRESRALFLGKSLDIVLLDPRFYTIDALEEIYTRYNYGGTVHDEVEKATIVQNIRLVGNKIIVSDGLGETTFDADEFEIFDDLDPDLVAPNPDGGDDVDEGGALAGALALAAVTGGAGEDEAEDDAPEDDADRDTGAWTIRRGQD